MLFAPSQHEGSTLEWLHINIKKAFRTFNILFHHVYTGFRLSDILEKLVPPTCHMRIENFQGESRRQRSNKITREVGKQFEVSEQSEGSVWWNHLGVKILLQCLGDTGRHSYGIGMNSKSLPTLFNSFSKKYFSSLNWASFSVHQIFRKGLFVKNNVLPYSKIKNNNYFYKKQKAN